MLEDVRQELSDTVVRELVQEIDRVNMPFLEWLADHQHELTPAQVEAFWKSPLCPWNR